VAASFDPLVVLLDEDGADEADDAAAVREDPDDVGAPADLAVEAFAGVVAPDLPPDLLSLTRSGAGDAEATPTAPGRTSAAAARADANSGRRR